MHLWQVVGMQFLGVMECWSFGVLQSRFITVFEFGGSKVMVSDQTTVLGWFRIYPLLQILKVLIPVPQIDTNFHIL